MAEGYGHELEVCNFTSFPPSSMQLLLNFCVAAGFSIGHQNVEAATSLGVERARSGPHWSALQHRHVCPAHPTSVPAHPAQPGVWEAVLGEGNANQLHPLDLQRIHYHLMNPLVGATALVQNSSKAHIRPLHKMCLFKTRPLQPQAPTGKHTRQGAPAGPTVHGCISSVGMSINPYMENWLANRHGRRLLGEP